MQSKDLYNWEHHENHIAAIYKLLGYDVTANINTDGQQTDLLCEKLTPGAGKMVLYVECKFTLDGEQNTVSKDTVNQFIVNFHALKHAHGWTTGVMVSNKKFSQFAKSAAKIHKDIVLKTVDELYADLFQIHSYLHSNITSYEAEGTFSDYIPPKAIIQDSFKRNIVPSPILETLFYDWLNVKGDNQLCLLGDFGAGKTTFLRHVHFECSKSFLSGNFTRMPLYIQLRDYYDVKDGRELIERFFSIELATKVPYRIFEQFSRAGRFLLLLDGFDEMGISSDSNLRRRNYLKLNQLITVNSKIAITCRPAYFVTHEELLEVFNLYKRQMEGSLPSTRGDKKLTSSFSELSTELKTASQNANLKDLFSAAGYEYKKSTIALLQLFDDEQIKSYLAAHNSKIMTVSEGQLNDKSLYERIGQIYDLEDLAKRPILLKLIVNTLPLFKKDSNGKYFIQDWREPFDDITPSVLYHVYTEGELTREYEKGEIRWQIDREQRRKLIAGIAYEMFQTDSLVLEVNKLYSIVSKHFTGNENELEQLTTDIRTCSFLSLDRNTFLRFTHKSFFEYYTAQYLSSLLFTKGTARAVLNQRMLPEEILYFLGDLIRSFYPAIIRVLNELYSTINPNCAGNALNLLNYAGRPRQFVRDVKINNLSYVKLNIQKLDFEKVNLELLKLNKSHISELAIRKTDIKKVLTQSLTVKLLTTTDSKIELFDSVSTSFKLILENSYIGSLRLTNTTLENTTVSNSTINMGPCFESELKNVYFINVLFMSKDNPNINMSKMKNVVFENCIFLNVDCDNLIENAQFKNCVFIYCRLTTRIHLNKLNNSHGIFLYKLANDKKRGKAVETKNRLFLWSETRAEREVVNFYNIDSADEDKRRDRRIKFLERLSWEDTLAWAFSSKTMHSLESVDLSKVREMLEKIDKQRSHLL